MNFMVVSVRCVCTHSRLRRDPIDSRQEYFFFLNNAAGQKTLRLAGEALKRTPNPCSRKLHQVRMIGITWTLAAALGGANRSGRSVRPPGGLHERRRP